MIHQVPEHFEDNELKSAFKYPIPKIKPKTKNKIKPKTKIKIRYT